MIEPDANGWFPIESLISHEDRVLLYFPKMGKGFDAFMSVSTGFISAYQWWKPTRWRPLPAGPVEEGRGASEPKQEALDA